MTRPLATAATLIATLSACAPESGTGHDEIGTTTRALRGAPTLLEQGPRAVLDGPGDGLTPAVGCEDVVIEPFVDSCTPGCDAEYRSATGASNGWLRGRAPGS